MADQEKHGNRPQVSIDGTPLRHDVEVQLERVVVDTSLHAPDLVEVRLRDQARDVLTRSGVKIGSKLSVEGSRSGEGRLAPLATVEVTTLEHDFGPEGSIAVIRGYDASHRLCRGRRTASYNDDDRRRRRPPGRAPGRPRGRHRRRRRTDPRARRAAQRDRLGVPHRPRPRDRSRGRRAGRQAALAAARAGRRRPGRRRGDGHARRAGAAGPRHQPAVAAAATERRRTRCPTWSVRGWDPMAKAAVVGRASSAAGESQHVGRPGRAGRHLRRPDAHRRRPAGQRPGDGRRDRDRAAPRRWPVRTPRPRGSRSATRGWWPARPWCSRWPAGRTTASTR